MSWHVVRSHFERRSGPVPMLGPKRDAEFRPEPAFNVLVEWIGFSVEPEGGRYVAVLGEILSASFSLVEAGHQVDGGRADAGFKRLPREFRGTTVEV